MTKRTASTPRRGRPRRAPADQTDARRRLLDAAAREFAANGYAATSLRSVAAAAAVTPAMVSYYFRDKWGLLEAVLVEGLELLLTSLERALTGPAETEPLLTRFVDAYVTTLSRHPWIPRIIVQEVISRDTSLRQLFVERFVDRALALMTPRLQAEAQAGRLRADLDPRYTLMSVVGACLFPYLAEPVLGRILGYRIDAEFAASFAPHTSALLGQGLEVRK